MGDKLGEAMGENALGTLLSLVAIRGFHKVTQRFGPFTLENIALWERLGGANAKLALRAAHVTLEMALGAGAGYAAQRIVRSPVEPTEDEALQWAMQGASIVASHWIMSKLSSSRQRLEHARARVPADAATRLEGTLKAIDDLHGRAQRAVDNPVDAPQIIELFAEHHRLVGAEAALTQSERVAKSGNARPGATNPVIAAHEAELRVLLGGEPDAFEQRYRELMSSLSPVHARALRRAILAQRVEHLDQPPADGPEAARLIETHAKRLRALRVVEDFSAQGFHGTGSDLRHPLI